MYKKKRKRRRKKNKKKTCLIFTRISIKLRIDNSNLALFDNWNMWRNSLPAEFKVKALMSIPFTEPDAKENFDLRIKDPSCCKPILIKPILILSFPDHFNETTFIIEL